MIPVLAGAAWTSGPAAEAAAGNINAPATQAPAAVSANARRDVDDRISLFPSSQVGCNALRYGATDSEGTTPI
jgi:hypothetical protein